MKKLKIRTLNDKKNIQQQQIEKYTIDAEDIQVDLYVKHSNILKFLKGNIPSIRFLGSIYFVQVLQIHNSKLKDLSGISQFVNLQELYLPQNLIQDLNPLVYMNNIQILDLSDNQIDQEQDIILDTLENLEYLDLSGNSIVYENSKIAQIINEQNTHKQDELFKRFNLNYKEEQINIEQTQDQSSYNKLKKNHYINQNQFIKELQDNQQQFKSIQSSKFSLTQNKFSSRQVQSSNNQHLDKINNQEQQQIEKSSNNTPLSNNLLFNKSREAQKKFIVKRNIQFNK